MGPRAADHFVLCRMIQWVEVVYAATDRERDELAAVIAKARRRSVDWVVPYLRVPVDELGYVRRMMEICYRGEVRPESTGRASSLVDAQAPYLRKAFGAALRQAASEGELVRSDGRYAPGHPVPPSSERRWTIYFHVSRLRASARWIKHMVTFDNWLGYLVRKVERHSDQSITLTRLERDWPLIFLWPRAIYFLRVQARRNRVEQRGRAAQRGRATKPGRANRNEELPT